MILVRLSDGMGNQMFQYALGRALSLRHNVPFKLDLSAYQRDPKRVYSLGAFRIAEDFMTMADAQRVITAPQDRSRPWWNQPVVVAPSFPYNDMVWQAPADCYLVGYWQSERYFAAIADHIRSDFTLKAPLTGLNLILSREMAAVESVSLHVRRGDYVSEARVAQLHGTCSLDYYRRAVAHIAEHVERPVFYVFSDDPDWTRENLRLDFPTHYVTHNGTVPTEDLRLMSCCRHHIIANSSFSWWGAWLGHNPGKQVCAPARWFAGYDHDTRDLVPANWVRLDS